MKDLLLTTSPDVGLFLLRLVLALVIFPHGAQKLLGWFGGYGLKGTMGFFTGQLKIPAPFGYLDRKSTRLNSSHQIISYAVFCLKKKKQTAGHRHDNHPLVHANRFQLMSEV